MKSQRKVYLINPKFQLSFIFFSTITSLLGMLVFFVASNYFFWSFKNLGKTYGIPENHIFFTFINDQGHKMNMIFLVSSIVFFIITIIGSLLLSHRVAGPIYRLTSHLNNISEKKELSEVKFRSGDFFIELQDAFNGYINRIK
jgi:methyl-accepting chemotaxis protein